MSARNRLTPASISQLSMEQVRNAAPPAAAATARRASRTCGGRASNANAPRCEAAENAKTAEAASIPPRATAKAARFSNRGTSLRESATINKAVAM